ncbi:MAG: hypothetical protein A3F41_01825 [Coxiella sp. RIFCSPHIGHO2_12_FULL_44_14]|nr:MAG: hypothetical protein A3F41_01825 [Coxiella sp. RIFCSPHIGHO2_12_FULL_44_14]
MDKLFIRELVVSAGLGILPSERTGHQALSLDIEIGIDAAQVALADRIDNAIDYAAVREHIQQFAQKHRFNLIETFAQQLSISLMQRFPLQALRLTVIKPHIFADAKGAGVIIERGRWT